uniref:SMP-30/gluconolactonase/LRE family protein n=1 Tax=Roseihalotalea indica TaxID=2867963 RepID=A0AA49JIY7_9BACT|nr:SMP-30/gluconolactonase/LRE family protein [Tunicatimonas sp. TK19036]
MHRTILLTLCIVCFVLSSAVSQAKKEKKGSLVAKGAELQQVASDYTFTEGPAVDEKGNVYFTDQPNNRILKWSTDGTVSVFMEDAGRANGLYFDNEGNLIACADAKNELWKIDQDKNVSVLIDNFEGKKLNGPNDLWVSPNGGIYLTDPFYKRDYWDHSEPEIESQNVYYLAPGAKALTLAADNLKQPNGIVGSPDGKTLYVADIGDSKTYAYQINDDGSLSDRRLFVEMGSDGMTLDSKGNLYLTGKAGVTVFNPQGEQIDQIPINENWTANVCFGGKNQKKLFITAMKSLYTIDMKAKGAR